jgi:PhnB protein
MSENAEDALDSKMMLSPLLSVRNGICAVEFYKHAFGANELSRIDDGQGSIVARLSIDKSEFWLADETPSYGNFSPESLGGSTVRMILTVDDPDALFARAVRAGATVVDAVSDKDYGWRVGRIADPFGHHWEIGKPLHDIS